MQNSISSSEEFDIMGRLQFPHLAFGKSTPVIKKTIARHIFNRKNEDLLLVTANGFEYVPVLAGLSDEQIVYMSKSGPRDYKENISKLLQNKEMINSVLEIAQAMDEDLGRGVTQNQERVKNVMQYIKDNRVAFEF